MNIKDSALFKRLTGIKPGTFEKILNILNDAEKKQKALGGRKNKLNMEIRLRMTFEYWREYRTYFHIGQNYKVSESTAYKNIVWIENTLIKSKFFSLPGAKSLAKKKIKDAVLLIDVTETPIERPKKNKNNSIQERKNVTL